MLGPELPSNLAEFGAEVIKVELPGIGDTARSITPFGRFYKNQALCFAKVSRNKYHCTLDVRKPDGVKFLKRSHQKLTSLLKMCEAGQPIAGV